MTAKVLYEIEGFNRLLRGFTVYGCGKIKRAVFLALCIKVLAKCIWVYSSIILQVSYFIIILVTLNEGGKLERRLAIRLQNGEAKTDNHLG